LVKRIQQNKYISLVISCNYVLEMSTISDSHFGMGWFKSDVVVFLRISGNTLL